MTHGRAALACSVCLLSSLVLSSHSSAQPSTSPLSAADERTSFRLADAELEAEVVLTEPEIEAPVAISWDAAGRLYVVQMTDYPLGPGTGSVLQFTDADGDGRFERRTCFADGLPFPNGITPWQNGMLITAAPDIWFYRDLDDDGVADERERLLTGFAEGNQQLRVNGLFWGLDNWIYGANGRSDGDVRWVDADGPPISIRRRDFRFRPGERRFEAIAGHSQFGTAHDDWGRRFPVFNNLPVRQVVVENRYVESAHHVGWPEATPDITSADDAGRVYALTTANFYIPQPAGYSTSACGPEVMRAGGLGDDYRGDIFICEPAQNLVTRRRLLSAGVRQVAERPEAEREREFLASTDPWFHPVFLATGPDGALWMVDFYRKAVEHPHWVVADLRERIDWREGASHGRIWRIRRRDRQRAVSERWPAERDSAQLVDLLDHENGWWRDSAQRLLVERGDLNTAARLRDIVLKGRGQLARIHALYTLAGLSRSHDELLTAIFSTQSARLCEHGLILAVPRLAGANASEGLVSAACELADHPDERLRFQLALTLSEVPATEEVLAALVRLARANPGDVYQRAAILTAAGDRAIELARRLADTDPSWRANPSDEQRRLLADLHHAIGATCLEAEIGEVAGWLADSTFPIAVQAELWERFLTGLQSRRQDSVDWRKQLIHDDAAGSMAVRQRLDAVAQLAMDSSVATDVRVAALRVGAAVQPASIEPLRGVLVAAEPIELQRAVLTELLKQPDAAAQLFDDWPRYGLAVRQQLLRAASERPALAADCIRACQTGAVGVAEIDPATLTALRRAVDGELREQISALIDQRISSDRQAVVDAFRAAVELSGDRLRGAEHFARLCLACHRLDHYGGDVGPNLSAIATHAKATLLVELFDPSRQVLPDYAGYVCVTQDGRSLVGRIAAETDSTVTIRRVGEADQTVPRAEIDELVATGKSVMPDGLENGLTVQDVADLLEFLQMPDVRLLPHGVDGQAASRPTGQ